MIISKKKLKKLQICLLSRCMELIINITYVISFLIMSYYLVLKSNYSKLEYINYFLKENFQNITHNNYNSLSSNLIINLHNNLDNFLKNNPSFVVLKYSELIKLYMSQECFENINKLYNIKNYCKKASNSNCVLNYFNEMLIINKNTNINKVCSENNNTYKYKYINKINEYLTNNSKFKFYHNNMFKIKRELINMYNKDRNILNTINLTNNNLIIFNSINIYDINKKVFLSFGILIEKYYVNYINNFEYIYSMKSNLTTHFPINNLFFMIVFYVFISVISVDIIKHFVIISYLHDIFIPTIYLILYIPNIGIILVCILK